jgi:ribosomal protein S14
MQLNNKDKIKRLKIDIFENKQKCLKSLKHNRKLRCSWWSRHKLSSLPKRRMRNRCIVTERGKAINKSFKLSRLEFSRWVKYKILFGVKKSSW